MTEIIIRDEELRARACRLIAQLDLSKPWEVTVEPYKKQRTLSQNSLYWKWVETIANETGNDADEVHDALKDKFLVPKEVEFAGEKRFYRSTTKLKTHEMSEYMNKVHAFAGSYFGIMLPVPEEMHMDTTPKPAA